MDLSNPTVQLVVWVGVFILIVYVFMILPRKKQEKKHTDMVSELRRGDAITTIGGIKGEVAKVKEDTIVVKVADGVEIEFVKRAVAGKDEPVSAKK